MRITLIAAILVCAANLMSQAHAAIAFVSFIEYQGQRLELAKTYRDFRDYKDDPENLTAAQCKHVEALLRAASFGPSFVKLDDLNAALVKLQFPGYGLFYANQLGAHPGSKLEFVYVEVPRRELNRYLAFEREADGSLRVVDDFIAAAEPEIVRVDRNANGALEYRYLNGKVAVPLRR